MADEKPLNPKQERFAYEYVKIGNMAKAYEAAGYSPKGAFASASVLLNNPKVAALVAELRADIGRAIGVTSAMIAEELWLLGRSDIGEVIRYDNNGVRVKVDSESLAPQHRRAIKAVTESTSTTTTPEGYEIVNRKLKFDMHEKKGALDSLNKMLGYNAPEKIEAKIEKVNPIDTTDEIIAGLAKLNARAAAAGDSESDAGQA